MIKAVVFDWDGTLADTLPVHLKAYRKMLKGIAEMKESDLYANEGKKSWEILLSVAPQIGEEKAKELAHKKQKLFRELLPERVLYPGAEDVLRKLKVMGLKIGLVTGTVRENVESTISSEIAGMFDHITTADEVNKAKPHPEPYLRCLEDLTVRPGEAVAVENAPLGVESAKAAGMRCIAVETTLPEEYLKEADYIVRDLKEVEGVIDSLLEQ